MRISCVNPGLIQTPDWIKKRRNSPAREATGGAICNASPTSTQPSGDSQARRRHAEDGVSGNLPAARVRHRFVT
jgi:hypothetical protein